MGEPVMLSISFEPPVPSYLPGTPLAVTADTPIEQPEGWPVTGVIPRMDRIGLRITHVG
jgi:hypothetical protein